MSVQVARDSRVKIESPGVHDFESVAVEYIGEYFGETDTKSVVLSHLEVQGESICNYVMW